MTATRATARTSRELWNDLALGMYEGRDDLWRCSRPVSGWMIRALDPHRGATVLELAAGTGETGFLAARWVGPTGRVISTDFAPAVVAAAARRAEELGLMNVTSEVMDAERLDLDDASVDGVLCRWGYMVMQQPRAAFAESRRVLRQGGRLALSVFAAPQHNPWAGIVVDVLRREGLLRPSHGDGPGLFALSDPELLAALLTTAGFAEPAIAPMSLKWPFANPEAYWRFVTQISGVFADLIAGLEPDQLAAVRSGVLEAAGLWATPDGGLRFPVLTLNAVTW